MAIGSISIYSLLAVSKLSVKFAEKKKWLPSGYYHRLSMQRLKEGDLKAAQKFNTIALDKSPENEGALVVRDLITMRRDVDVRKLLTRIDSEEERILQIKNQKKRNQKKMRHVAGSDRWQKIIMSMLVILVLGIPVITFSVAAADTNSGLKAVALGAAGFFLLLIFIYSKTIGEKKRITRSTLLQELQATLATFENEIKTRENRLRKYKQEFIDLGHHHISKV